MTRFQLYCVSLLTLFLANSWAYIPALPTNNSDPGIQGNSPNTSDTSSHLNLHWYPLGSYTQNVSYQLVKNGSDGFSQGALVHFSEEIVTNDTTVTPWIALVACDVNATNASMEDDIFTLARDRGAVSALLYSKYSKACIINSEYADPANFEQVLDIYSTIDLASARLIEERFLGVNQSLYSNWNASRLNSSSNIIQEAIETGNVEEPTYLLATLTAYNATEGSTTTSSGIAASSTTAGGHKHATTSLAMVILYAITGVVSALFCVVIISGAIRAVRHPERYGPRSARPGHHGGLPGQTRTQGLTRAFLDTFPVIKWRPQGAEPGPDSSDSDAKPLDVEGSTPVVAHLHNSIRQGHTRGGGGSSDLGHAVELAEWKIADAYLEHGTRSVDSHGDRSPSSSTSSRPIPALNQAVEVHSAEVVPPARPRPSRQPSTKQSNDPVMPDAIGRETCPICIVDFEEGDDLRVLPCAGHHRFHQYCVDPWLLELSSSCPICRQDFLALEAIMSGGDAHEELEPPHAHFASNSGGENRSSFAQRFSRYVRNARRRRQTRPRSEGRHPEGHDAQIMDTIV